MNSPLYARRSNEQFQSSISDYKHKICFSGELFFLGIWYMSTFQNQQLEEIRRRTRAEKKKKTDENKNRKKRRSEKHRRKGSMRNLRRNYTRKIS